MQTKSEMINRIAELAKENAELKGKLDAFQMSENEAIEIIAELKKKCVDIEGLRADATRAKMLAKKYNQALQDIKAITENVVLNCTAKPSLPFKIKSVFLAKDRLNELDEVPKLPDGYTDYWKATEMLCKKDGGRLPTVDELAQLASYIYGTDIEPYKDYYDLELKNIPPELAPIYEEQGWFALWSGREGSATFAYRRSFGSSYTLDSYGWRGYAWLGVCLGE